MLARHRQAAEARSREQAPRAGRQRTARERWPGACADRQPRQRALRLARHDEHEVLLGEQRLDDVAARAGEHGDERDVEHGRGAARRHRRREDVVRERQPCEPAAGGRLEAANRQPRGEARRGGCRRPAGSAHRRGRRPRGDDGGPEPRRGRGACSRAPRRRGWRWRRSRGRRRASRSGRAWSSGATGGDADGLSGGANGGIEGASGALGRWTRSALTGGLEGGVAGSPESRSLTGGGSRRTSGMRSPVGRRGGLGSRKKPAARDRRVAGLTAGAPGRRRRSRGRSGARRAAAGPGGRPR